jgi:hypothetical protein
VTPHKTSTPLDLPEPLTDQQFINRLADMVNSAEKPADWDEYNDTARLHPSTEKAFSRNAFIPGFKDKAIALVEYLTDDPARYEMLTYFLDGISEQGLPRIVDALTRYRDLLDGNTSGRKLNDILSLDDFFMRSQVVPINAHGINPHFETHLNSMKRYPEIKDAHPRISRYAENQAFINAVEQNPQNLDGVIAYFKHYGISDDFQQSDYMDYLGHGSLADGRL